MSTIVGVETDHGVALAADRSSVTEGTVGGSVDRVFEFEAAGGVLRDEVAAAGSGAQIALGILEDSTNGSEDPEERAREVLASVAERDAETGDDVDSYSLESEA